MATDLTVSSNYNGEVAGEIIGAAFKEADTIAKGLITVLPDIKFKISLRKIEYANGRTDYSCGFAPQGSVTLSEKTLEPKKIKNELELCKEDFLQVWSSMQMGFSAHNNNIPNDIDQALIAEILADTAEATDEQIWQGVAATDGQFGGFIPLFDADANIIKDGNGITGLGAAISKSNVISELEKVTTAIPVELRRKTDMIFGVSNDVANFYSQALINPQISSGSASPGSPQTLQYGIYTMEIINGLPANTIVVFQKKNLYFGTGLMSDHNELRIKDMDESDLSGQIRYKMVYTAGVQYVNSEEIIHYLSTT